MAYRWRFAHYSNAGRHRGKALQTKLTVITSIQSIDVAKFADLSDNTQIQAYATNLIYLTTSDRPGKIEQRTLGSIFSSSRKKGRHLWFLHMHVTDEPYTMQYEAHTLSKDIYHYHHNTSDSV